MKKKNLPGTRGANTPRVPFVYFVRNPGPLQLVGGLVVCWNELDVGGQGEAWRNETRRCVTNFNCKSTRSCDLLRVGSNNLRDIIF